MDVITVLTRVKAEIEAIEMTAKKTNCEHALIAISNIENVIAAYEAAEKEGKEE